MGGVGGGDVDGVGGQGEDTPSVEEKIFCASFLAEKSRRGNEGGRPCF